MPAEYHTTPWKAILTQSTQSLDEAKTRNSETPAHPPQRGVTYNAHTGAQSQTDGLSPVLASRKFAEPVCRSADGPSA